MCPLRANIMDFSNFISLFNPDKDLFQLLLLIYFFNYLVALKTMKVTCVGAY